MQFVVLLSCATLALSGPVFGQSEEDGAVLFADACTACHGPTGAGDGPLVAEFERPPPDLRTIATRNDGRFDRLRTARLIDGRAGDAAHGGPMPLFSGKLTGPPVEITAPDGEADVAARPVLSLVLWLEAHQMMP